MPEVAIGTQKVVIPALGAGVLFQCERLEYQLEYFVQHFSVCLRLLIQPLLRDIAVLDWNRQECDQYNAVHSGHLADLRR